MWIDRDNMLRRYTEPEETDTIFIPHCHGLGWMSVRFPGRKVRRLVLPDGLKCIDAHAVQVEEIDYLDIPDTVEEIAPLAFATCGSIRNLTLPGSLKSIGMDAFKGGGCRRIVFEAGSENARSGCRRVFGPLEPGCRVVWKGETARSFTDVFDGYGNIYCRMVLEADNLLPDRRLEAQIRYALIRGYLLRAGEPVRNRAYLQKVTKQYVFEWVNSQVNEPSGLRNPPVVDPLECLRTLLKDRAFSFEEQGHLLRLCSGSPEMRLLMLEEMHVEHNGGRDLQDAYEDLFDHECGLAS